MVSMNHRKYSNRKPKLSSNWSLISPYSCSRNDLLKILAVITSGSSPFMLTVWRGSVTLFHHSINLPKNISFLEPWLYIYSKTALSCFSFRLAVNQRCLTISTAGGRLRAGFASVVSQNDIPSDPDTYSRKSAATPSKEHTYGKEKCVDWENAHILYSPTSAIVNIYVQYSKVEQIIWSASLQANQSWDVLAQSLCLHRVATEPKDIIS